MNQHASDIICNNYRDIRRIIAFNPAKRVVEATKLGISPIIIAHTTRKEPAKATKLGISPIIIAHTTRKGSAKATNPPQLDRII